MAIQKNGNGYRVKIFDKGALVVDKTFASHDEAQQFERIEKAKLLLGQSGEEALLDQRSWAPKCVLGRRASLRAVEAGLLPAEALKARHGSVHALAGVIPTGGEAQVRH